MKIIFKRITFNLEKINYKFIFVLVRFLKFYSKFIEKLAKGHLESAYIESIKLDTPLSPIWFCL
jgi:hypothetical protein